MRLKRLCFGLTVALGLGAAPALADYNYTGATITEDFNGLISSGTTPLTNTMGLVQPLAGTGFDTAKTNTSTTAFTLRADTGTNNAGGPYSYGAAGSTERALGSVASGTNQVAFGAVINNTSGVALDQVTIRFTQENWRSSTSVVNTTAFSYALSGGSVNGTNYLTAAGFTPLTLLDLVGPAPVTTNGALNGNDPANQASRTATFSVNIAAGASLFIRWQDPDNTGNDAGLAIDDFSFSARAVSVPEPASILLTGLGGLTLLAGLKSRRRMNSIRS